MRTNIHQQEPSVFFALKSQSSHKVERHYNLSDDYYSPTDWDREPGESSQDYDDRYGDLESWNEWGIDHDND